MRNKRTKAGVSQLLRGMRHAFCSTGLRRWIRFWPTLWIELISWWTFECFAMMHIVLMITWVIAGVVHLEVKPHYAFEIGGRSWACVVKSLSCHWRFGHHKRWIHPELKFYIGSGPPGTTRTSFPTRPINWLEHPAGDKILRRTPQAIAEVKHAFKLPPRYRSEIECMAHCLNNVVFFLFIASLFMKLS